MLIFNKKLTDEKAYKMLDSLAKGDSIYLMTGINPAVKTVVGLICLAIILVVFAFAHIGTDRAVARHTSHVACRSFQTQAEAQKAYNNGATYLDGNGNGIACQGLK